ncbi:MAG: hypothetical protein IJ520_03300 [Synergistaceae bacterium]|nr:hypothetical protein [Synergistaceae bacterium]
MKFIKKPLILILKFLLLIIGFCAALWIFLPWREVGGAAVSLARPMLEQRGVRLNFAGVRSQSGEQGFTIDGLEIGGMMNFNFDSLTIQPQILDSLMNFAPVCSIRFRGGSMTMGQKINFGDGSLLLTASPNNILIERLRTNGDFAVNGFIAVNPAQARISRAEASLSVPQEFESNMQTLQNFLPLVKDKNGNWFLRRTQ